MRLYRVLFYREDAAPNEKGGALYVPPQAGPGRINNPDAYEALYVGDAAAGVCAEVFYRGQHRIAWSNSMFAPLTDGSRRVLAWYEFSDDLATCNLDDPQALLVRKLRPSQVVTRDYSVTQQWALRIFRERRYAGVAWWSYCDARWATYGLWDRSLLKRFGIEELTLSHPAIIEAASVLQVTVQRPSTSSR